MENNIIECIKELKKGNPIIITDSSNRENEGDLVVSAQTITNGSANFLVKHSSGVICLATTKEQLEKLKIPVINSPYHQKDPMSTAFTLSLEAKHGIGSGISAIDRARSINVAGNPLSTPDDIVVPGHIFPLEAKEGGIFEREGHTEASIELCKLAGLWLAAAIVEISSENGTMLKGKDLEMFASTYKIPIISTSDIKNFLLGKNKITTKTAEATLPTKFGTFKISTWEDLTNSETHIALSMGNIENSENVPVRIHSQCLTGDVFHSLKCDCGEQLDAAMQYISKKGIGILVWLRQEGRGIGITNKIKAYNLQETKNLNTIDANLALGLPIDARTYDSAIEIINSFKPKSIELLTNNPEKLKELSKIFKVSRRELLTTIYKENKSYLETKENLMHHLFKINK